MKKIFISLMLSMAACMGANAMSFSRAQAEALYLTDKMAYELNLNDQQYNDAYEINLDYFLSIDSPSDLYGVYYNHRINDLRCILHDWQYSLLFAADYFLRPLVWRAGSWFFPIYSYYNRDYFYFSRPSVWISYRGGHSRYYHHAGFYAHRRPVWSGGLRGHAMHRPSPGMGGRVGGARPGAGRPVGGRGYRIDFNGNRNGGHSNRDGMSSGSHGSSHNGGSMNSGGHRGSNSYSSPSRGSHSGAVPSRGNSFDGSSSRISGSRMSGGSRGGSYSSGSSRSGGMSRGGSYSSGSSRSGGMSRSGGFSGGSRGGSRGGGSSRSGRR